MEGVIMRPRRGGIINEGCTGAKYLNWSENMKR